jgi:hypothetical protein
VKWNRYCVHQLCGVIRAKAESSNHGRRGFFVSTVGRDEAVIRGYIKNQEAEDNRLEQLSLWR